MSELDYIYLASPYNHPERRTREFRVDAVSDFGFQLVEAGLNIFCPITQSFNLQTYPMAGPDFLYTGHNDPVVQYFKRGRILSHSEWMRVDKAFLSKARLLVIYCLDGWEDSKGIHEESDFAQENKIPIVFIKPEDDFLFSLTKIKVALGLEDAKEAKVEEKCWKGTHDFEAMKAELDEKFKGIVPRYPDGKGLDGKYVRPQYNDPAKECDAMKEEDCTCESHSLWEQGMQQREKEWDTPPAPQEFPYNFDSVLPVDPCGNCTMILTTYPGQWPCQQISTNAVSTGPINSKGVKAEQAKDKPTTLNFPWAGLGASYDDLGLSMAKLIKSISPLEATDVNFNLVDIEQEVRYLMDCDYDSDLQVNEVFVIGMKKHGLRTHLNYDKVDIELLVDALGRHILKGLDNLDEESGLPHAAHALANVYMIRQILRKGE